MDIDNPTNDELRKRGRTEQRRAWYRANREKIIERSKQWRQANKTRHNELKRLWAERNPDKVNKQNNEQRWRTLGLKGAAQELYDQLWEEQNGLCAICSQPWEKRKLAWDHNRMTGGPRGLLCGSCNIALGWFEKLMANHKWFEKAEAYLEKWEP